MKDLGLERSTDIRLAKEISFPSEGFTFTDVNRGVGNQNWERTRDPDSLTLSPAPGGREGVTLRSTRESVLIVSPERYIRPGGGHP